MQLWGSVSKAATHFGLTHTHITTTTTTFAVPKSKYNQTRNPPCQFPEEQSLNGVRGWQLRPTLPSSARKLSFSVKRNNGGKDEDT